MAAPIFLQRFLIKWERRLKDPKKRKKLVTRPLARILSGVARARDRERWEP